MSSRVVRKRGFFGWVFLVKLIALAAATMLGHAVALAQGVEIDRLSDADLKKLTQQEEQRKTLPMFEVLNRLEPQNVAGFKALVSLTLRELGYGFRDGFTGSDDQLQRWVIQFQRDLSEPETGVLTFSQSDTLFKRYGAVNFTPIHLAVGEFRGTGPSILMTDQFASAEGTWVIEGDEIAHPLNVTTIKCYRNFRYCFQIDIEIDDTGSSGNRHSGPYTLFAYDSLLPIMSWTDQEIVLENNAACRNNTITINAKAKEVYEVSRNNGENREGCTIAPLEKPRILKLVNPRKLSSDYFDQRRKEADTYYNREVQEYLETIRAEKKKAPQHDAQTQTVSPQR
jgi:hypothetical protein